MMRPPSPRSRIAIAAARPHVNEPRRCVSMTVSKSRRSIFHSTRSRSTPAFATSTSTRPNSASAVRTSSVGGLGRPDGRDHAIAVRPRLDVGDGLPGGVGIDVVDHDGGSGRREGERVRATEAAARARDDGDLAVEADRRAHL